jgi:ribonuclease R
MADWQSLDPEAAREAEKYENPIPSRELILQHLADRGSPANREQLVEEFGLTTEDQIEALRRRLRAMERDAQLIYTRRGTYAPVDKLDLILGRIVVTVTAWLPDPGRRQRRPNHEPAQCVWCRR